MTQFDQTLKFDRAGAGAVGLSQALGDASADKRLEVLRRVAETGSISQAAREADISYKAAWQAIDTLTNLAGEPLVDRTVGGAGGGGAHITPQGIQLLALADALAQARAAVLARFDGQPLAAASLGLQTSMRNQLPCRVESLQAEGTDDPAVRVWVRTVGAARLVAQITRESADLLGLAPGLPVLVLCKATAVRIATGTDPTGGDESDAGAAHTLSGMVERVSAGRTHDEIALALPAGGRWVGFAPHPCTVAVGDAAWAAMAPSSLVLAR